MVPINGFINNEKVTQIKKADIRASRINELKKQFAITALKNADPPRLVGTSDASFDIDRSDFEGIYGGDYDIDDDDNISYHSSDGSDKDDSDVNLSLGNGAKGTSPPANPRNTAEQSPLRRQIDDLPDWLQEEMIDNQAYGASHLLSAPVTKCFSCIACNNRIDVTDPRGWSRAFLRKLGATAWEVFDNFFEEIGPDMDWDGNDGLRNTWDQYYRCPDPAYIQSL